METAADHVTVLVADEMRALYRAFRASGGEGPRLDRAAGADSYEPSAPSDREPRVERTQAGPIGPVRLMRTGLRPLSFEGAVAMHVSTAEAAPGRGFWHELTVYLDAAGGVVAHLALRVVPEFEAAVEHCAAERLVDAGAFEAFLEEYDPAAAFSALGAVAAGRASAIELDRVAVARADFVRLVSAFCGPRHPAAIAARLRLAPPERNH